MHALDFNNVVLVCVCMSLIVFPYRLYAPCVPLAAAREHSGYVCERMGLLVCAYLKLYQHNTSKQPTSSSLILSPSLVRFSGHNDAASQPLIAQS